MQTRMQKWGNSLAVRIPKAFTAALGVTDESPVEITMEKGVIILRPVLENPSLDELLAGITDENIHDVIDTGPAVGNEVW